MYTQHSIPVHIFRLGGMIPQPTEIIVSSGLQTRAGAAVTLQGLNAICTDVSTALRYLWPREKLTRCSPKDAAGADPWTPTVSVLLTMIKNDITRTPCVPAFATMDGCRERSVAARGGEASKQQLHVSMSQTSPRCACHRCSSIELAVKAKLSKVETQHWNSIETA